MNGYWKTVLTFLAAAVMLVGWGMTWANQSARICANQTEIGTLKEKMESVADQTSESEKAIVRMETKIEYIIKGVDEIKSEVKGRDFE
jgi:septal ring factor EnvC (AmiA/AmiB activator)